LFEPFPLIPNPQKQKAKGTEEQTTARGTEENRSSLFLWLLSVSSVPNAFSGFGMSHVDQRKRREKTPLTPLTPCEAILFV
jgi:hypothetical protein